MLIIFNHRCWTSALLGGLREMACLEQIEGGHSSHHHDRHTGKGSVFTGDPERCCVLNWQHVLLYFFILFSPTNTFVPNRKMAFTKEPLLPVLGPRMFPINLLNNPTTLKSLSHTIWICFQYLRRESNITPKYLAIVFVWTSMVPTVTGIRIGG